MWNGKWLPKVKEPNSINAYHMDIVGKQNTEICTTTCPKYKNYSVKQASLISREGTGA